MASTAATNLSFLYFLQGEIDQVYNSTATVRNRSGIPLQGEIDQVYNSTEVNRSELKTLEWRTSIF